MKYSFTSKNKKEYSFSIEKNDGRWHSVPETVKSIVLIQDCSEHGFYFPILPGKQGLYVQWYKWLSQYFLIPSGFFIPRDLKKRVNKVVKLLVFS